MSFVPAFDLDQALDRMDGDRQLLREVVELLLDDIPVQLQAIQDALNADNTDALTRAAHSLKGAVAIISAQTVQQAAYTLECSARNDQVDRLQSDLRQLQHELDRLLPELQRVCDD